MRLQKPALVQASVSVSLDAAATRIVKTALNATDCSIQKQQQQHGSPISLRVHR